MVLPLSAPLTPEGRTYLSIKKKLNEQDLCVVKADKGKALIIMNQSDYHSKMMDLLQSAGASPVRFSVQSHSDDIRALIKSSDKVITRGWTLFRKKASVPKNAERAACFFTYVYKCT